MGLTVLDAGVIVAALDASDAHHRHSIEGVRAVQADGDSLVLPASAFAECLVWPFRAGDQAVADAEAFIDALPAAVVIADRSIARRAARLRATHGSSLRLPDALVVATAIEAKADRVLTTDRGWPALEVAIQIVGGQPAPSSRGRGRGRARER